MMLALHPPFVKCCYQFTNDCKGRASWKGRWQMAEGVQNSITSQR